MVRRSAILAIDEGTTGTRAGLVDGIGAVHHLAYQRLGITTPGPGVVEQDATEILRRTVDCIRQVVANSDAHGWHIESIAIATQRATALLWDDSTGEPYGPAVVWQDTRHAEELAHFAPVWDARLAPVTGRPTGVRSPYLWAAHRIAEEPAVAAALTAGRLRFGTVDSWLLWNLTSERVLATSSTNATSGGALDLVGLGYCTDWLEALGFPSALLPPVIDDACVAGTGRPDIFGREIPIEALIGDQHAALVGLGCITAGQSMVVHGTGSFVDLVTGPRVPEHRADAAGTLGLIGWRDASGPTYTVETFTAATGSTFDWACERLGWFASVRELYQLAAQCDDTGGLTFLPMLTGTRTPVVEPRARGALAGLSLATTKPQLARALVEGVTQFVATSMDANRHSTGLTPSELVVGGGMARSDVLLQEHADLMGLPVRRGWNAEHASLRGAAYLAGCTSSRLWDDLATAVASQPRGESFDPAISPEQRETRRQKWSERLHSELEHAQGDLP